MKSSDFTQFLSLVEEREPIFREALAAANRMVEGKFLDHVSYPGTAMSHPQNSLSSPPSDRTFSGETISTLSGHENGLQGGDVSSGLDLDALLAYSFRQAVEDQQPKNILDQCYLWQSTRFNDLEGIDETPSWFPRLQRSQSRPHRYQMLPFYHTERWQLAVFDVVEKVVVCYDTTWTSGVPNSTFRVGQALYAHQGWEADQRLQSLQQWHDKTLGNPQGILFDCYHEKVSLHNETFAGS